MKCKNCARFVHVNEDNERTVGEPNWCFYVSDSPCPELERDCKVFAPLRNADRIRAMTDEELANFLMDVACRGGIQTESGIARWTLIDWLKQEVAE